MKRYIIIITSFLLAACSTNIPAKFEETDTTPSVYPDYTNLVIPANIAPLNIRIDEPGDEFVTCYESTGGTFIQKGNEINIPISKWKKILRSEKISITVYSKNNGIWKKFKPVSLFVAEDIDPFISYRIIPPSFVAYEKLSINQRNLTNFREQVIYSNALVQKDENGQCINCHSYKNYRTDNMQFHCRQYLGGTILVTEGKIRKINLKTDSTLSAGVYPAWHPTHDYIAYSTNQTKQSVHTADHNRIEVLDVASDLILYDIKNNSVSIIENDSNEFECFPAWAPDGKTLYYVSAYLKYGFGDDRQGYLYSHYKDIHYNLYKKSFDPDTRSWGKSEMIINADSLNKSITLPRVSPDGKYLLFTMGQYGVFHIWHKDADLYLMDLSNDSIRPLTEINSNDVESYHSWSSNGKWIIFSTRRDDGGYTRLYISHFNENGTFSKPFLLPQKSPDFSDKFLYSYNIPEFMIEPVSIKPNNFASFIKNSNAESVSFEKKILNSSNN